MRPKAMQLVLGRLADRLTSPNARNPPNFAGKNIWTKNTFIANLCLSGSGMMWICIWTVHYIPRHFLVSTNASLGLRGTSFPPRSRRSPSKFQALLMEPKALIKILEAKLLDGGGILGIQPGKNVNDACIYMHMYIYTCTTLMAQNLGDTWGSPTTVSTSTNPAGHQAAMWSTRDPRPQFECTLPRF